MLTKLENPHATFSEKQILAEEFKAKFLTKELDMNQEAEERMECLQLIAEVNSLEEEIADLVEKNGGGSLPHEKAFFSLEDKWIEEEENSKRNKLEIISLEQQIKDLKEKEHLLEARLVQKLKEEGLKQLGNLNVAPSYSW